VSRSAHNYAVIPRVKTPRLVLRAWRGDDLDRYAAITADPEVMRHMFTASGPLSRQQAKESMERFERHWADHGCGHWAVEERRSGVLIGRIGLLHHPDWPEDPDNVEVGWLLDRNLWGRGLATEGGVAAVHFGFGELGLQQIISITNAANHASRRVMEKVGLHLAGHTRWRGHSVLWCSADRGSWTSPALAPPN
jgi:RimJ/RimL family protein N-acetyltransferase